MPARAASFSASTSPRVTLRVQVAQVLGRFLTALDGAAGLVNVLQLDQGRSTAPSFGRRPVPVAIRIAQAQRADAAEVIHRQQVIQFGEGRKPRIGLAALGVGAGDDAPTPDVGRGICDGAMKYGVVRRARLVRLVAPQQLQVG